MNENKAQYLGDGLYVRNDGYQIVLMANSKTNPTDTVYLDGHTLDQFLKYIKQLQDKREE